MIVVDDKEAEALENLNIPSYKHIKK